MAATRARAVRMATLTAIAAAMLTGCIVTPPALVPEASAPTSPSPSATPAPSAAPAPSATPSATPTSTPEPQATPDAAQCQASDAAMAQLIEATGALDAAVQGEGANDWATADVVIADLRTQYDTWLAATSDPILLASGPALDAAIEDAAGVVSRRDDAEVGLLGTIPYSLTIILAAADVVSPCDFG